MIPLLERLFKEIEHGDREHRNWLWDKMENFSKKEIPEKREEKECDHVWTYRQDQKFCSKCKHTIYGDFRD